MRSEPTRPRPGPTVVGIVGAGTMGAGIAQVALEAGARVLLHDVDPSAVDRARARIADGLARRMRRLASETSSASVARIAGRHRPAVAGPDLESLAREADLVIEAALEDLELKRRVFARLDAAATTRPRSSPRIRAHCRSGRSPRPQRPTPSASSVSTSSTRRR